VIIVRIWEGLGNQMFQYAYARALAKERQDVYLDLGKAYDDFFPRLLTAARRETTVDHFRITLPSVDVEKLGRYSYLRRKNGVEYLIAEMAQKKMWPFAFIETKVPDEIPLIHKWNRNCYIKGWFQNENVFAGIRRELLREFSPKEKIRIPKMLMGKIFEKESVAVHIRRGDYVTTHIVLPVTYYKRAKTEIEKRVQDPIYIVFSDDYKWAKEHVDLGENVVYVDEVTDWKDYEQLYVMSRCKNQIIANSTFSWWAAWLNQNQDKVIVMPKQYVMSASNLRIKNSIVI